jgi:hypothetical protein
MTLSMNKDMSSMEFVKHMRQLEADGASDEVKKAAVRDFNEQAASLRKSSHSARLSAEGSTPMPSQAEINQLYTDRVKETELDENHVKFAKALEASKEKAHKGPILQINDLSYAANKHLSASARYDLSQKATQTIVKYDDGRFYKAIYFATRVRKGDEELGAEYLARIMNDLSQRGLIHSTLAPISSLNLAQTTLTLQSVVFAFVLIPQESHKEIQAFYPKFVVQEGDVGHELYDLSPILSEGEFLTTIRFQAHLYFNQPKDIRSLLQEELNRFISILPKGTRVRSITQLAITDLSVGFEVKFHNELLQEVKRVEFDYKRAVAKVGDGLKQFNVITGITYIAADGSFLYK